MTSEPGKGSAFSFQVQLKYRNSAFFSSPNFEGRRGIVVDPNPKSRQLLEHFLQNAQVNVVSAGETHEAFDTYFCEHRAGDMHPDILIVDTTSPHFHISHIEHWFTSAPGVKIIFITGLVMDSKLRDSDRFISAYVSKPIVKSEFLETVDKVIQQSSNKEKSVINLDNGMVELDEFHGKQVLIVEDNVINLLYATNILKKVGLAVDVAKNGVEAVEAVTSKAYNLVFMDMEMPVMDGLKATAKIRNIPECKDLPIVAMTAHAMDEHRQQALDSGMNDYISKPIDLKILNDMLVKWLKPDNSEAAFAEPDRGERVSDVTLDNLPGIDLEEALARLEGDRDLFVTILSYFYDTYADAGTQLQVNLDECKNKDALMLVHSLRGAAGNLGAIDLHRACSELESAMSDNTIGMPGQLIVRFEKELSTVIEGLAPLILSKGREE